MFKTEKLTAGLYADGRRLLTEKEDEEQRADKVKNGGMALRRKQKGSRGAKAGRLSTLLLLRIP